MFMLHRVDGSCLRCAQENIYRNFGMPQPNGYRKALRFMRHADKFGFPIVTFVDTPGAFAGKNAEELGQGEVRGPATGSRVQPGFRAWGTEWPRSWARAR